MRKGNIVYIKCRNQYFIFLFLYVRTLLRGEFLDSRQEIKLAKCRRGEFFAKQNLHAAKIRGANYPHGKNFPRRIFQFAGAKFSRTKLLVEKFLTAKLPVTILTIRPFFDSIRSFFVVYFLFYCIFFFILSPHFFSFLSISISG